MNRLDRIVSRLALPAVLFTLVFIPAWAWWYEDIHMLSKYPKEAKVFTIWWGDQGMTLDRITAYNYWLKGISRLDEIRVEKGNRVILRLISTDVYHGFVLPTFGINEVMVKPGDLSEVDFIADKVGSFLLYCTVVCGLPHQGMNVKFTVDEPKGQKTAGAEDRGDGAELLFRPARGLQAALLGRLPRL
jgi:heme/copper-type cytochrome/quinol oxidase subunit 2